MGCGSSLASVRPAPAASAPSSGSGQKALTGEATVVNSNSTQESNHEHEQKQKELERKNLQLAQENARLQEKQTTLEQESTKLAQRVEENQQLLLEQELKLKMNESALKAPETAPQAPVEKATLEIQTELPVESVSELKETVDVLRKQKAELEAALKELQLDTDQKISLRQSEMERLQLELEEAKRRLDAFMGPVKDAAAPAPPAIAANENKDSVQPSEVKVTPVKTIAQYIRQPAPAFSTTAVVDGEFKTVSLNDYSGKYLVIVFYPLDWTFVCPTEIIAFSDCVEEFRKIGAEVVAVSVDSEYSHLAWINTPRKQGGLGPMKIPILADVTKKISRDYGVLLEEAGVALRGLFIIDAKGILRQVTVNDLPVGRSVDETIRLVKAFQFVDVHGEVCPANWTPGADTMKADPKGSQEYFSKQNYD